MSCPPPPHRLFELHQDPEFLNRHARHYRSRVIERNGLLACQHRLPLLGGMSVSVGAPEVAGAAAAWLPGLRDIGGTYARVLTSRRWLELEPYRVSPPDMQSFYIELAKGEHELWRAMRRTTRKEINKAAKGSAVRVAASADDRRRFYEILRRASNDGGLYEIPAYDYVADLAQSPSGELFVFEHGGEIIGGMFCLLGRHMHAMFAGIEAPYRQKLSSRYFYWQVIRWAIERGYATCDLGAQSPSAQPSLSDFKLSLGASMQPAYRYEIPLSGPKRLLSRLVGIARPTRWSHGVTATSPG